MPSATPLRPTGETHKMTFLCALKFVPRVTRFTATFSLSLLASCSSLQVPAFMRDGVAPASPADAVVASADPAYQIGPEDALDISVWRDETLKGSTLVRPDGGISFPLAGDLIVAGKTAAQVQEELVKRLSKFIPEPVVTVSVVRVSSYRIYVL